MEVAVLSGKADKYFKLAMREAQLATIAAGSALGKLGQVHQMIHLPPPLIDPGVVKSGFF